MQTSQSYDDQTARISLQISRNVKKQGKQNNLNRAISFVAPSSHHTSQLSSLVSEAGTLPSDPPQNRQDPVSNFFLPRPAGPRPFRRRRRFGEAVSRPHNQNPQERKNRFREESFQTIDFTSYKSRRFREIAADAGDSAPRHRLGLADFGRIRGRICGDAGCRKPESADSGSRIGKFPSRRTGITRLGGPG